MSLVRWAARPLQAARPRPATPRDRARAGGRAATWLVLGCYLLGAVVLTWHLWADPAGRAQVVPGHGVSHDIDLFAWFLRYEATAISPRTAAGPGDHGAERAAGRQPDVEHVLPAARRGVRPADAGHRPAGHPHHPADAGVRGLGGHHVLGAAPVGRQPGRGGPGRGGVRLLPRAADRGGGALSPAVRGPAAAHHRRTAEAGDGPRPAGAYRGLAGPAHGRPAVHRRGDGGADGRGRRGHRRGAGGQPPARRAGPGPRGR